MSKVIQYKDLCETGKTLSLYGLVAFLEHINECKQCNKINNSKTKKNGIHRSTRNTAR